MHIKYHLTRHQAVILGSIGTILVTAFGPDANFGHYDFVALAPLIVGLIDSVLHKATGVLPDKPGDQTATTAASALQQLLETIDTVQQIQQALSKIQQSTNESSQAPNGPQTNSFQ